MIVVMYTQIEEPMTLIMFPVAVMTNRNRRDDFK